MSKWICETCVYYPPSSGDGKPCSYCNPDDPLMNCYSEKDSHKEQLIDLCYDFINFYKQFIEEIKLIPNENEDDLVLKWRSYYREHSDVINKLFYVKHSMKKLEERLIMEGKLCYKDEE